MLYLMTGTPGAGKTLNTIEFIDTEPSFKDRPVYYFNVAGASPELGWTELSEEEAREWYTLPHGSIILMDEAYKIFPIRGPSQKVPLHVEKLAEHRHSGYDVILICQKVKGQVDSFIRGLVNHHWHYSRKFGANFSTRFMWEVCQENVDGYHEKREAQTKVCRFNKKYFNAYKSAEIHTVKKRPPYVKILILIGGVAVGLYAASSAISLATGFNNRAQSAFDVHPGDSPPVESSSPGSFVPAAIRQTDQTPLDWYEARSARIEGFPHTAPVYDELTQPATFPRPNCILLIDRNPQKCVCHSQQATRMDVPHDLCVSIVKHGWFDDTRPETRGEKERVIARARESQSPSQSAYSKPRATIIGKGSRLDFTTASN